MPTINQINGRLENNQTIQFYNSLGRQYEKRVNNWRNDYFNFKRGGEVVRLSISGNFIYGAAMNEFYRVIQSTGYNYSRDNRKKYIEYTFAGNTLGIDVHIHQDINGVHLCVMHTNFKAIEDRYNNFTPLLSAYSHQIKSNSTFEALDIQQYFERYILPKYLYSPGLFRNIQILTNCTKKDALKFYRERLKKQEPTEPDSYKAIVKQIRKRLNIEVCDTFSEKYLLIFLKEQPRQKKLKKLFRQPNAWELSDSYFNQYDTDGHEIEFINEVFDDYPKNAMFI